MQDNEQKTQNVEMVSSSSSSSALSSSSLPINNTPVIIPTLPTDQTNNNGNDRTLIPVDYPQNIETAKHAKKIPTAFWNTRDRPQDLNEKLGFHPNHLPCFNDVHHFTWSPLMLPIEYDPLYGQFKGWGIFCSFNCMKRFVKNNRWLPENRIYSLITTMSSLIYKIFTDIILAPPIWELEFFGGQYKVSEYRAKTFVDHMEIEVLYPNFIYAEFKVSLTKYRMENESNLINPEQVQKLKAERRNHNKKQKLAMMKNKNAVGGGGQNPEEKQTVGNHLTTKVLSSSKPSKAVPMPVIENLTNYPSLSNFFNSK